MLSCSLNLWVDKYARWLISVQTFSVIITDSSSLNCNHRVLIWFQLEFICKIAPNGKLNSFTRLICKQEIPLCFACAVSKSFVFYLTAEMHYTNKIQSSLASNIKDLMKDGKTISLTLDFFIILSGFNHRVFVKDKTEVISYWWKSLIGHFYLPVGYSVHSIFF